MNENLKYWLALNKLPNFGPATIKKLYDHFGSGEAVWNASIEEISKVEGVSKRQFDSILKGRSEIDLEKGIEEIGRQDVLTLDDPDYPALLKNIYDPPSVLYLKGKREALSKKAIAIVGTRKPTPYGLSIAQKLASELACFGFVIVSGFASGIDSAAHRGALDAGGETIAVFGCGLDVIFPPENIGLVDKVVESGALISEFALKTPTSSWTFPQRNRIISGLSLGVIVVEGAQDSGSLITAKSALEQGREVFAIPGSIESENSRGPHWLIKQGAKLVESVADIFEELNLPMPIPTPMPDQERDLSGLSSPEKQIYDLLMPGALHIDAVSEKSELSPQEVSSTLMILEIKGFIRQMTGKMFSAC